MFHAISAARMGAIGQHAFFFYALVLEADVARIIDITARAHVKIIGRLLVV